MGTDSSNVETDSDWGHALNITFRLSRRDIVGANVQALFQQPFLIAIYAIASIWIGLQSWQDISPTRSLFVRVLTVIILVFIPLLAISAILGLLLLYQAFSKSNKLLLAEQAITVDENFLVSQSEYVRSEIKWKALQRIVRTRQYLFLYFTTMNALVIPSRAFRSNEQWDSFVAFCKAKLGQA